MMIGFYPRLRALFCKQNYDTGLFKQLESILGTVVGFVNLMYKFYIRKRFNLFELFKIESTWFLIDFYDVLH